MFKFVRQITCIGLTLFGAFASLPVQAQYASDIDIYAALPAATDAPNVLFVVDNTANWNTAFANEKAALVSTFNALPESQFKVGMMMFTETGGGNSNTDGGYVRAAVRLLDASYRTVLNGMLSSLDVGADKSNGGKASLALAEAYNYLAGKAAVSGNGKEKTDYAGNASGTAASRAVYALQGNALASRNAATYSSPPGSGCARNYIIYISNGPAQDNSSDTSSASARLTAAYAAQGMTRPADITGLTPNGSQSSVADEWARFMKASPQGVSTYVVEIDPGTNGQEPGWTALLKSVADRSGGDYFAVSSGNGGNAIRDALGQIFSQIQAVNSVFASASLPVSVNARGTYLNQVFMGTFRPDGDAHPRWRGNLKQFKFGYDPVTDTLSLVDANGNPAVSGATGFLSPSAVSYWTQPSTFWVNQPVGTPPSASDSPDGEVVEKGGIAQGIRTANATSQTARKVYTCLDCAPSTSLATTPATQFVTGTAGVTGALLGVADPARGDLIGWVRGTDNAGDETGPAGGVTIRPSVHGDVLHSRPAVVNYGGSTGVRVFYGANDGMLRAANGSQTGAGAGQELWSFIPQEHLGKLNRLRSNSPEIRLSTTPLASAATPRDYFVDGPIGVYQKVNTAGVSERVILFSAMRRGGRLVYALDVTTPDQPLFLWKKSHSDIPVLGQTWSEPKVARIKGHANPVIIMGAGYDNVAEDASTPGATSMGHAVLVLDAITGTLLKTFSTLRSVPADVALIDADYDGFVDRAYAVDLGGNIYRIDLEKGASSAAADWGSYRLASLAGGGTRKFFHAPDVVLSRNFAAILVGSGDREKPLLASGTADAFFTVYDNQLTKGTPAVEPELILAAMLGQVGTVQSKVAGCFIPMAGAGEKVVNAPATIGGVTYFSSNRPTPPAQGVCSANLGEAKVYAAPLFCKEATDQKLVGGGLPPSPVTGVVTVSYISPDTGQPASKQVPFIIGAPNAKGSGIEGSKVTPVVTPTRKRRYWFLENAR